MFFCIFSYNNKDFWQKEIDAILVPLRDVFIEERLEEIENGLNDKPPKSEFRTMDVKINMKSNGTKTYLYELKPESQVSTILQHL